MEGWWEEGTGKVPRKKHPRELRLHMYQAASSKILAPIGFRELKESGHVAPLGKAKVEKRYNCE